MPAWRGIAGWALMLAAFVLAAFVIPWPLNGTAALALVLALVGAALVYAQILRTAGRQ